MQSRKKVLYISYDGMTDPLGQSQVLSYLSKIADQNHTIHILSYEKPDKFAELEKSIRDRFFTSEQLFWHPLEYHKKPPVVSTLNDIRAGIKFARELHRKEDFDVCHVRGYVPALIGEQLSQKEHIPYIFDMRGWWPDEKLESGFWDSPLFKPVYRYFKNKEALFFRNSAITVSLTQVGKDEIIRLGLKSEEGIHTIPTCVDFNVFQPFNESVRSEVRKELGIDIDNKVLLYSGSLGGNYSIEDILNIYQVYKETQTSPCKLLVLSKTDPAIMKPYIENGSIDADEIVIVTAAWKDVHRYLYAGDLGLILYKRSYSVIGRSPTKLGEYWACGLKAIGQQDIGDLNYLAEKYPGGIELFSETSNESIKTAIQSCIDQNLNSDQLRTYAKDYYDLDKGVSFYKSLYQLVLTGETVEV